MSHTVDTMTVEGAITAASVAAGAIDLAAHGTRHNPGGADALSIGTPADITDTTNSTGSSNDVPRGNHTHAHGNRGGGSLHAAATTSVNGFMSSADKTILDRIRSGFLQYQNASSTTNNTTTFSDITLDTDLGSFTNGFFTKSSATEFRADFTGRIKIHYSVSISEAGNNRGSFVRVVKNGTLVTGTLRSNAGSSATSYATCSHTQIIEATSGDLFKLQFASSAAGQLSSIAANGASLLVEIYTVGLT